MITVEFLIRGRVQGVGYRRFAQKQAEALSLSGWTRNLDDGRVQVRARGPEDRLGEFEEKLRRGPLLSSVEKVDRRSLPDRPMSGFDVRADGSDPGDNEEKR